MRKFALLFVLLFATSTVVLTTAPVQAAVERYEMDPVHSSVLFRAKHYDVGYTYGMFLEKSGSFAYDPENPSNSSVEWTVQTDSVFTNHRKRDSDLRGPDFLNAKQYPTIHFESTRVEPLDGSRLRVVGDLRFHGTTREISTVVELTGSGQDNQGNFRRGFLSRFTIQRSNFGMDYLPGVASDTIQLTLSLEGVRQ